MSNLAIRILGHRNFFPLLFGVMFLALIVFVIFIKHNDIVSAETLRFDSTYIGEPSHWRETQNNGINCYIFRVDECDVLACKLSGNPVFTMEKLKCADEIKNTQDKVTVD